jgi:hypothetical protein
MDEAAKMEVTTMNIYDAIETVVKSLDVGGEQSRAFAEEIRMLRDLLGQRQSAADVHFYLHQCPDTGRVFLCETGKDNNIAEIHDLGRWRRYNGWCIDPTADLEQRMSSGKLTAVDRTTDSETS